MKDYASIVKELAGNRIAKEAAAEQEKARKKHELAEREREILAPLSAVCQDLLKEFHDRKLFVFDRTGDFYYPDAQDAKAWSLRWEICSRDEYYAKERGCMVVGLRNGKLVVGLYGRAANPCCVWEHTHKQVADLIPEVLSTVADMIRHR